MDRVGYERGTDRVMHRLRVTSRAPTKCAPCRSYWCAAGRLPTEATAVIESCEASQVMKTCVTANNAPVAGLL